MPEHIPQTDTPVTAQAASDPAATETVTASGRHGLASRGFICLVLTQALGALNDNMFRWLAIGVGTHLMAAAGLARLGTLATDEAAKSEAHQNAAVEALSWGIFWFTLPYLLLPTYAGWLADRFPKRTVIVWCKAAEIVLMVLVILAILSGHVSLMFGVLFLVGAQAALFGPAKYGSIPEILRTESLSNGNGVMAMVTVMCSAVGTVVGLKLAAMTGPDGTHHIGISAAVLIGTAIAGWLASLGITSYPAGQPNLGRPGDPFTQTWSQLRLLGSNRTLLRTALGIAFFYSLATLTQANVKLYGEEFLKLGESQISWLLLALVVGVGLGSVLAGRWSGGRVELGIVPLGAVSIVIASFVLFESGSGIDTAQDVARQRAFYVALISLVWLGASAGLFDVPLESFLQHRSPREIRGTLLAASNFVTFLGILCASGILYVSQHVLELSARSTFLAAGLATIPIALYVVILLPQATIRFVTWLLSRTVYRLRIYGHENLPETGGALLVANHVSWLDGILILISSSRPIRMLAYSDYIRGFGVAWLTKLFGVIPVNASEGPKSLVRSLATARESIKQGDLVCIFAEGSITRTGQLQPFQRGLMKIVDGTGAPVIPVYLDGLWGSIFSFFKGKFFWKLPRRWPYPVGILFGAPIRDPDDVHEVRQAVQELGVEAMEHRKEDEMNLPRMFLRNCRRNRSRSKVADSAGQEMTGGQLLLRTLIVKRILERSVLAADEKFVGVLLPPSVGGVLANAALPLAGRIPVNLNYTASRETINHCIEAAGIRHVITSKLFMTKMRLEVNVPVVYLEDFKDQVTKLDKAIAALQAYIMPISILERQFGLTSIKADDLLTIVFTSGSTGEPKGVMLSHHNVRSNVDAIEQMYQLKSTDVLLGVLPFFHSFGFTGTLWAVLSLEPKGVYHFNPLDARVIGTLCATHKTTIMMATPTFLRGYLKRCEKEQLQTVDLVVVGAEKMPIDLAQAFFDKFGARPIEGYGTTELSPVAAVNIPDHRSATANQKGTKEGSVGRPLPGTTAKIVDADTFVELAVDQPGLLLIKGPNVMRGYLNNPEKTAQVIRDGWYITGDIARIDAEGFITITDRASRFSKIGGEMVPHIKVEEILQKIVADQSDEEHELHAVITAIPDEKKGERLIVVHRPFAKPIDQVLAELSAAGLPNLWVPSRDSFLEVAEIPHLGTGKVDLKGLKALALEKFRT
jgi:acyl-[acyl-carrier-protein]-phospholipid O-acyltransferase/long-chain-fatty-acid--[acyl-carrier-protein] ligase